MIKIIEWDKITDEKKQFYLNRSRQNIEDVNESVKEILDEVRSEGDNAILRLIKKYDNVDMSVDKLRVSKEDIANAYNRIDKKVLQSIKDQIYYSKKFHEAQLKKSWSIELERGVTAGQLYRPIESVGLYVPGGTAAYPTVMQILGVAAKTAGVPRIIACTPPRKNNYEVIVAADLAGVDEIYNIGGPVAIAAMAYGTETVPKVLKVAGPGNIYVTAAKMQCFGEVQKYL